jgi:very-short-patch-repair endonuclease
VFSRTVNKTARARRLRRALTDAEAKVWSRVRNRQLGADFRRQHPAGPYVLDFYCPALRLAVELDGGQHAATGTKTADGKRTAWLGANGVKVMRFWNSDVMENLDGVIAAIASEVDRLKSSGITPTRRWRADLPLTGGGEKQSP